MVFNWSEAYYTDYAESASDGNSDDVFREGDEAMLNFARTISSIPGLRLFEFQRELLPLALLLAIPTMYFNIWYKYRKQVLARYGLTEADLRYIVSACAARRDGKSTFFQMLAAALVLTAPRRRHGEYAYGIGLVSINLEASKKMIGDIERLIHSIPNKPEGIKIYKTATRIRVLFPDGESNIIYGFQTGEVSIHCVCVCVVRRRALPSR
jgi:hypothetical protein